MNEIDDNVSCIHSSQTSTVENINIEWGYSPNASNIKVIPTTPDAAKLYNPKYLSSS